MPKNIHIDESIILLYKECMKPKEICDRLNISRSYYNKVIKNSGLGQKRRLLKKEFIVNNNLDEVVEMYKNKIKLETIAASFKTDKTVIKEILYEQNIELRVSSKNKDLSGQTRGILTIVRKTDAKDNKGSIKYLCSCECGKEKLISSNDLNKVKSCGCRSNQSLKESNRELITAKYVFWDYQKNARRRGYTFELGINFFLKTIKKDCYYCGSSPSIIEEDRAERSDFKMHRNGVDRKDNTIGYIESNCVPCCTKCNLIKGSVNHDEFINWIKTVYDNMYG